MGARLRRSTEEKERHHPCDGRNGDPRRPGSRRRLFRRFGCAKGVEGRRRERGGGRGKGDGESWLVASSAGRTRRLGRPRSRGAGRKGGLWRRGLRRSGARRRRGGRPFASRLRWRWWRPATCRERRRRWAWAFGDRGQRRRDVGDPRPRLTTSIWRSLLPHAVYGGKSWPKAPHSCDAAFSKRAWRRSYRTHLRACVGVYA